ncbi:hypothetical protein BJY04DRAFT_87458 [Aspergillus karnatakaensis]|uniref:uncharacterized protein n=1 Tax=Aspergillus karnatakaensis TaxID=1810916 RepID=UPI003CCD2E70
MEPERPRKRHNSRISGHAAEPPSGPSRNTRSRSSIRSDSELEPVIESEASEPAPQPLRDPSIELGEPKQITHPPPPQAIELAEPSIPAPPLITRPLATPQTSLTSLQPGLTQPSSFPTRFGLFSQTDELARLRARAEEAEHQLYQATKRGDTYKARVGDATRKMEAMEEELAHFKLPTENPQESQAVPAQQPAPKVQEVPVCTEAGQNLPTYTTHIPTPLTEQLARQLHQERLIPSVESTEPRRRDPFDTARDSLNNAFETHAPYPTRLRSAFKTPVPPNVETAPLNAESNPWNPRETVETIETNMSNLSLAASWRRRADPPNDPLRGDSPNEYPPWRYAIDCALETDAPLYLTDKAKIRYALTHMKEPIFSVMQNLVFQDRQKTFADLMEDIEHYMGVYLQADAANRELQSVAQKKGEKVTEYFH